MCLLLAVKKAIGAGTLPFTDTEGSDATLVQSIVLGLLPTVVSGAI